MGRTQFENWYEEKQPTYARFAEYIHQEVKRALSVHRIDVAKVEYRAKDAKSAVNKSQKMIASADGENVLKYTNPKNEIVDFAGVRIVAFLTTDIKQICDIITGLFDSDPDNYTNKLDTLGENKVGYMAIHHVVTLKRAVSDNPTYAHFKGLKCEIQVGTILHHAWAQIFHDRQYKFDDNIDCPSDLVRTTNLISGNLELSDRLIATAVQEYDRVLGNPDVAAYQAVLDMEVCEDALSSYMKQKAGIPYPMRYINRERVFDVLHKFDIKIIRHLDSYVTKDFVDAVIHNAGLFLTVDRFIDCLLISINYKTYFDKCYETPPRFISGSSYALLKSIVDIDEICRAYSLSVYEGII